MDATRVGCRAVAEWLQRANLVSSGTTTTTSPSSFSDEPADEYPAEWFFLYLLVLSLHSSATQVTSDLQSIPPVSLSGDLTPLPQQQHQNQFGGRGGHKRPISFILSNASTLVRPAFVVVSEDSTSSMEEPSSVVSSCQLTAYLGLLCHYRCIVYI